MAGTMHLKGKVISEVVKNKADLYNGNIYAIVDRELNEWLDWYKYKGMDTSGKYHVFMDAFDPIIDEFTIYTEEEMDERIALGEIGIAKRPTVPQE